MNLIYKFCLLVSAICIYRNGVAQSINWNSLNTSQQIVTSEIGWDYGVVFGIGYSWKPIPNTQLLLHFNFSVPTGNNLLDDYRAKIGGQLLILNKTHMKCSMSFAGVYRRYSNPLVRILNLGSEIMGTMGLYKDSWFIAAELSLDNALFTHFNHTKIFRNTNFLEVNDGWYSSITNGNFFFGIQIGASFMTSDCIINLGKVVAMDFRSSPLIPYHLKLTYNYRIN